MTTNTIHLEHALLDIQDLDVSLSFYRQLFPDWTLRWDGHTRDGSRWVHFGPPGAGRPGYLSLYETPNRSRDASDGVSIKIEHLGFAHPDVNALVQRLKAVSSIRPKDRVEADGFRRVYFLDPDGHELEFVQALEP